MTRRSWFILLFLAVIITFGIVFALNRSSADQSVEPNAVPEKSSDVTGAVHFVDCAFRTDGNAVIGIPKDVAQAGGVNLEPGDEIAVFTPDGMVCAGAAVWTGENVAIAAWADKEDTEGLEGLKGGDPLRFRIWDKSSGDELDVTSVTFVQGDNSYVIDGIYVVGSLSGG